MKAYCIPMMLVVLVAFIPSISSAQGQVDVVYLKDGSKIVGTIVELVPERSVKVRMRDGSETVFLLEKVERITKEADPAGPKDLIHESYTDAGINLGTPAGLNIAAARWFGVAGFGISGMYFRPTLNGIQADLGFRLSDNTDSRHVVALIGGTSTAGTSASGAKIWNYAGVAYQWVTGGFLLEVGISGGSGSFSSPQLLLQLGYVYRFLH